MVVTRDDGGESRAGVGAGAEEEEIMGSFAGEEEGGGGGGEGEVVLVLSPPSLHRYLPSPRPHTMSQSRRSALKGLSIIPFFPKCPERSISPAHIPRRLQSTSPSHGPLRILFCGSDHFSATSLKALYGEYAAQTGLIESIDVLCRADKRTGRGMKTLKEGVLLVPLPSPG